MRKTPNVLKNIGIMYILKGNENFVKKLRHVKKISKKLFEKKFEKKLKLEILK